MQVLHTQEEEQDEMRILEQLLYNWGLLQVLHKQNYGLVAWEEKQNFVMDENQMSKIGPVECSAPVQQFLACSGHKALVEQDKTGLPRIFYRLEVSIECLVQQL